MKNAAAITAQLVDMRNVGTHKVLKLTLHVPEEQALKAIAVFGWPTGVNPVAVAIAALDLSNAKEVMQDTGTTSCQPNDKTLPGVSKQDKPMRRAVSPEKRLAQQAGIACADPLFQKFLGCTNEADTAAVVRDICGVASRSEIKVGTPEGEEWQKHYGEFLVWRDVPEMSDCQGERV
jgi:hypothetical protein